VERFVSAFGGKPAAEHHAADLEYGVATEEEIGIETFDRRYRDEVISPRSVIQWKTCVGRGREGHGHPNLAMQRTARERRLVARAPVGAGR